MTYSDTIQMSPSELREHPEVELCACAHPRGLHTLNGCRGSYVPDECICKEFKSTGRRGKDTLITLPKESCADVEVNPALTQHRKIFFGHDPTDAEIADHERADYNQHVLAKIWSILADGERALDPDADPEYDTNHMYDLVRKGTDARKTLVDGERQVAEFLAGKFEEASEQFDVTLRAVNEAVESCAQIVEQWDGDPTGEHREMAKRIRSGK